MGTREGLTAIARAVRGAERVLLSTHINPDGDAVGSVLALRGILKAAGVDAEVVTQDEIPAKYRFLMDTPVRTVGDPELEDEIAEKPFSMAIFLDSSDLERVGVVSGRLDTWLVEGAPLANIDHHVGNTGYGDLVAVDGERASCAELIMDLADILEVELTPWMADQLFAAVLTDTGRFMFSNTTPEVLQAAGRLVRAGAEPTRITERIYFERPSAFYQLMGDILSRIQLHNGGQICVMTLTEETTRRFFPEGHVDTEGIVDFSVQIDGVELGAFVRQVGEEAWRVSLRSRGHVDVRPVAELFGGGGHEKAAGCRIEGSLEEVTTNIVAEMKRKLV
ncbi:bifunctional oligoribonuclease/PAP phosphatase NrnA [Gemmatimonadota bacterium]